MVFSFALFSLLESLSEAGSFTSLAVHFFQPSPLLLLQFPEFFLELFVVTLKRYCREFTSLAYPYHYPSFLSTIVALQV
jgi:hypothetical protein